MFTTSRKKAIHFASDTNVSEGFEEVTSWPRISAACGTYAERGASLLRTRQPSEVSCRRPGCRRISPG